MQLRYERTILIMGNYNRTSGDPEWVWHHNGTAFSSTVSSCFADSTRI
jgi:hypothetical protein